MQTKNQKGVALLTTLLIIVGLLALIGTSWYFYSRGNITGNGSINQKLKLKLKLQEKNLTKKQKEQLELVKQMSIEAGLIDGMNQLQMGLDFYFNQNKILPSSLQELYPQFVTKKYIIENGRYLYAYPKDRRIPTYHLGIKLEADVENQPVLKKDKDFNSISSGYINGFNGADPVYDVFLNNDIRQITERNNSKNNSKVGKVRSLIGAVEIYRDSHEGALPASIDFLGSILPPDILNELKNGDYFYVVSKDKKNFHVGAKLESYDSYHLKSDDDFNSSDAGYTNGFNGKDPIYDKIY